MDYALSELLSREEMLQILRQRKLDVADIETLPDKALVRIYKTFAVPLARREPKNKEASDVNFNGPSSSSRDKQNQEGEFSSNGPSSSQDRQDEEGGVAAKNVHVSRKRKTTVAIYRNQNRDEDAIFKKLKSLDSNNQARLAEKRPSRTPSEVMDDFLSIVAKRCKI